MIHPIFEVHLLNESGRQRAKEIASSFDVFLQVLCAHCPEGRELAIVRTKLEEACFFAKKAMANVKENQL